MLISSLMLEGGGLRIIAGLFGKPLGKVFGTSQNGAFAVLCGFLCGYPMGAKVTADLTFREDHKRRRRISALLLQ